VPLLRAELLARFPPADGDVSSDEACAGVASAGAAAAGRRLSEALSSRGAAAGDAADGHGFGAGPAAAGSVWSTTPAPSEVVLVLSCGWQYADQVADVIRDGAKRYGLVCYDPQSSVVNPNAPGYVPGFRLSSAWLAPVADPADDLLERTVRHPSADNSFVVLERADGWFVQVGHGRNAGAAAGTYALEYQEGATERHFRRNTTDVEEAVRLLREFHRGGDAWRRRHGWRRLEL
jgi:hypothetical protein